MSKRIAGISAAAIIIIGLTLFFLYPTPEKSGQGKNAAPRRVNAAVEKQMNRLRSNDPIQKAHAAIALRGMGDDAIPAIPLLAQTLKASQSLAWVRPAGEPRIVESTSASSEAAKTLISLGKSAVGPLLDALATDDELVRVELFRDEVLRILRAIGPSDPDLLLAGLHHQKASVRAVCALVLGNVKDMRALPALAQVLEKDEPQVRKAAARSLGNLASRGLKDSRATVLLIAALRDQDPGVRADAAYALGAMKDATAVEPLVASVRDQDPGVRAQAAFALGVIKDGKALEPLVMALKDENYRVRANAAGALGVIKDSRAVPPLIGVLNDQDWYARQKAAHALGAIKDSRAVEPLISALRSKDHQTRLEAAKALGELEDARAVKPLTALLKDENRKIRARAASALKKITGKDFPPENNERKSQKNSRGKDS